jgi:hypothetical protein
LMTGRTGPLRVGSSVCHSEGSGRASAMAERLAETDGRASRGPR